MTSRFEPRAAHGKARELAEILQRGGHLPPMSDDELTAALWNLITQPAIADELIAAGYGLGPPGDWSGAPSIEFRVGYSEPNPDRPVTEWPA